ncbi:CheW protein [Nitrosospira sp. Nl5]|uniref:chemotaxis protein CheW n=1 Tax=Nitrosospira sp. Nl5 TaxID=200120 RepID=UPI000885C25C|nr:chemotaxis protein CheW [Nitrosospira sp. Nl5]SCY61777.1 CheW protein [Nitrosospira sp. Nl5]
MNINAPASQQKKKQVRTNFREITQRLENARALVERAWAPTGGETQRILQARALALAQERPLEETSDESIEVVEFTLAYERYAVESRHVRQVASLESLTPLPCTPAFLLGIVNLRGEIFPVIDLKKVFELPEKGLTDLNKVIVLQSGKVIFSIVADAIVGVRRISVTRIQPSLPTLTGVRENYLKGVTPERLVVLDAEKLLADENLVVEEQVAD